MQAAQQTSFGDLGLKWYYWIVPIGFTGLGGLGLLAPGHGRGLGWGFVMIGVGSFLWPFLRLSEKMAPRVTTLRSTAGDRKGLFIPTSKVQSRMAIALGTMAGVGGLLALIWSDDLKLRSAGAVVFISSSMVGSFWLYRMSKNEPGILLTKEGVLWHEPLLAPRLIPWESITAWYVYQHQETPSSLPEPSLGVRLSEAELEKMSKSDRHEVKENLRKFEAHLYYQAETLLAPLAALERVGNYYRQHPEAREELTSEAALVRLNGGAVDNPAIQPV